MTYYLDTSVIIATVIADVHTPRAEAWFARMTPICSISDFGALEFAAAISRLRRMNRLDFATSNAGLDFFDDWVTRVAQVIRVTAADIDDANLMVREFSTKLSAPDAIHLAIARSHRLVLTTFDLRLADAARMQNVDMIVPS